MEKSIESWREGRSHEPPEVEIRAPDFLILSDLDLMRNRFWKGSETRRCPQLIYPMKAKVSLPFWFLSKGRTS